MRASRPLARRSRTPSGRRGGRAGSGAAFTVAALCLAGVAVYGSRGSLGLFITPWQERFVASRGSVALVSTVGFLVFAGAQPLAGRLLETVPGRRLVLAGLGLCAAGFGGATVARSLWQVVLLIGVVSALGTGFASLPVLSVLATNVVHRREGLVFGFLTAAAAGGQIVVLPVATAALTASLSRAMAVVALLLGVAAIAVLVVAPRSRRPQAPTGAGATERRTGLARLFREPGFWQLLVPFFICGYTTTGLVDTHLIPFAVGHHIDVAIASSAMATLAAFNVTGVLLAGALTDRVNRGKLLAVIYITRAATLLVLPLLTTPRGLFLFAAVFGLADFATVPPTTSLTRRVFRSGGWTVALGVISAAHQIGSALGAFVGGWLFDLTGDYRAAFATAAASLVVAAVLSWRLADRRSQPPAPPAPAGASGTSGPSMTVAEH